MTSPHTPEELPVTMECADNGGWMPIETAPRDGTRMDLWCRDGDTEWRETDCWFDAADGSWLVMEDGCTYGLYEYPTHWMPLPQPPKGA